MPGNAKGFKVSKFKTFITSSLGRKLIMALTGLFLCLFLVAHLAGNLQLLIPGEHGKLAFNEYSKFMTSNPFIKVMSYVTYLSIIFHALDGWAFTFYNRQARPVGYAMNKPQRNTIWSSRNMGILGTLVFIFIVIHMRDFWFNYHWGDLGVDANGNTDLHAIVIESFQHLWYVILYVIGMVALGYHLVHGFASGFQTLGINHDKYTPVIKKVGIAFAILIPAAFAVIPIYVYLVY